MHNDKYLSMTGLEFMQSMFDGTIPYPPIADTMPLRGVSVEKGYIVFSAQADERHLNMFGSVHGGFAATIMDSVTGCAVVTALDAGLGCVTIELHVNMIRMIPLHTKLLAEGRVIEHTHSLGVAEANIKDEQDKLYVHATATCMILRNHTDNA